MPRIHHILIPIIAAFAFPASLFSQGFFSFDYEVAPLRGEMNSAGNDYAPVETFDGGELYFTSYREEGSLGDADIFRMSRSDRNDPASWGRLLNPGSPFNTKGNDGSLALFRDDRMIVFATEGRADGEGSTDLYVARFEHGRLRDIRSLGDRINSDGWESQPAISPDERRLYFVSNREDGIGGGDIWMAEKVGEDGDGFPLFGAPVNLGPEINTDREERSPTLALDGRTLYFASDGHEGFGGYDIFMTTRDGDRWSTPANLGSIINSRDDDLFFFAPRNDGPFYFASSRRGGAGGLDIYNGSPNVFGRGLFRLTLNIRDGQGNPLDGTGYVLDLETGDTISRIMTLSSREDYVVHLPAGRAYEVIGADRDGAEQRRTIAEVAPDGTEQVDFIFGRIEMEPIDLSSYTIPFFVTGYYRPNTPANLEDLFERRERELQRATYIESITSGSPTHEQYRVWGEEVEEMFGVVRDRLVNDLLPRFDATASPGEVLEIRVTGYADPQTFTGRYHENESVPFVDAAGNEHVVSHGTEITNLELSGLRAAHSIDHLDALLTSTEGSDLYRRLRQEGRIRYVPVAGDVARDAGGERFEVQRRIGVVVRTR